MGRKTGFVSFIWVDIVLIKAPSFAVQEDNIPVVLALCPYRETAIETLSLPGKDWVNYE